MSKRLPVPSDLEHLIEKRDDETVRRGQTRRRRARAQATPATEAVQPERRQRADRRRKRRRKSDS